MEKESYTNKPCFEKYTYIMPINYEFSHECDDYYLENARSVFLE